MSPLIYKLLFNNKLRIFSSFLNSKCERIQNFTPEKAVCQEKKIGRQVKEKGREFFNSRPWLLHINAWD
jgi:hypothetical protein